MLPPWAALVLILKITAAAVQCPDGFSEGTNDICYKVFSNQTSYFGATSICEDYGGQLASIHNAFTNNLIASLVEEQGILAWLGLKCSDTLASNCFWDDGQGSAIVYNAFAPGNPSVIGDCVMMMSGKMAGQWSSGDCDKMLIGFACQVTKEQLSCGDFSEYNEECYKAFNQQLSAASAESVCNNNCGHLVSIHGANENAQVAQMFAAGTSYVGIGLAVNANNVIYWRDGSRYDYNNFGMLNPAFGSCVALSLTNELVSTNQWISVGCDQALPFVCKRDLGKCDVPATTITPSTTPNPTECVSPQFFDQSGTIYSPGYPSSYDGVSPCVYVMTVTPTDDVVDIHFLDLQLGLGSRLELYDGFVSSEPFGVITGSISSTIHYTSTTNVMKMVYRAGNQSPDRWVAQFSAKVPTTLQITSPGYPQDYPPLVDCRYEISTTLPHRIKLTFGQIDTEQCCDVITVYDYDGSAYYPVLDRFAGQIAAGVKVFNSTLNQIFVEFHSDSSNQRSGFSAVAVNLV
ncbi:unnamed protein product [Nippostrongylus brasiliensis]|uniref:CUB domain-containing protein n=1 Tax=Nippostrongylus brasiliensis TaxID=27835 RepID=A0A0N4Y595_NIPBR|nr:unnamed protein product [Nippostrongylus brasiliensis]